MTEQTHGWIRLRDLRVDASVGVYPGERGRPRPVIIDVGVWAPITRAAASESLSDTIDYDTLAKTISEVSRSRHFSLIETLCEELAVCILERFGVERVSLELHKPGVSTGATASVSIERSRSGS